MSEIRAKYTADELADLGKKGQAFKNSKGDWSYPVGDVADLKKAIRAVGRGGSDHDDIRAYIIKAAGKVDGADLIPDNWNKDGSLKDTESKSNWDTLEQRDTANDVFAALEGALVDAEVGPRYGVWVQDWYGAGADDEPYVVVYRADCDLWQDEFSYSDEGKIVLAGAAVKVRPVTSYVERAAREDKERRTARLPRKGSPERRSLHVTEMSLETRTEDDRELLHFSGLASVFGVPYPVGPYSELIERGAFKRTLNDPNLDVQLLVNHTGLPLARTTSGTLTLRETDRGLLVEADLDPEDPDVQALVPKMRRGDVTEMSFAFRAKDETWTEDRSERRLKAVDIQRGDVSIVSYGASPTTTATLRSQQAIALLEDIGGDGVFAEFVTRLEQRAGKKLSSSTMETLTQVLNLVANADEAVDEAQPLLAELMGVPNPDDTDPAPEDGGGGERAAVPLLDHTTRARAAFEARRRQENAR